MSVLEIVQVGAATAKTAIDAADEVAGVDAHIIRLGILHFLHEHALTLAAELDAQLLQAYRSWLGVALEMYRKDGLVRIPDYMRAAGLLNAELQLAEARANGTLPTAFPKNASEVSDVTH